MYASLAVALLYYSPTLLPTCQQKCILEELQSCDWSYQGCCLHLLMIEDTLSMTPKGHEVTTATCKRRSSHKRRHTLNICVGHSHH